MAESKLQWVKTLGFFIALGGFLYWYIRSMPPSGQFSADAATGPARIELGFGEMLPGVNMGEVRWRAGKNIAHVWTVSDLCERPPSYPRVKSLTFRLNRERSCYELTVGRLRPCNFHDRTEDTLEYMKQCE